MIDNRAHYSKLNYLLNKFLICMWPMGGLGWAVFLWKNNGWAGPKLGNPWADFHRLSPAHSELCSIASDVSIEKHILKSENYLYIEICFLFCIYKLTDAPVPGLR